MSSHLFSSTYKQQPAYPPGHAQLCVCRRPCCHYSEHGICTNRGNTDLSSSRTVGVLHHRPAPCEYDKEASQYLPPAESRMWQTAQHQLERCELNPLQPPGVSWRHTGPNVVISITYREHQEESRNKKQHHPQTKNLKMGSHSNHTRVVCSSGMVLCCRVCLPGGGTLHPCKETGRDTG